MCVLGGDDVDIDFVLDHELAKLLEALAGGNGLHFRDGRAASGRS